MRIGGDPLRLSVRWLFIRLRLVGNVFENILHVAVKSLAELIKRIIGDDLRLLMIDSVDCRIA